MRHERTVKGDESREALLEAALDMFVRRGLGAVTTREIAAAAGQRNEAAVHYYFGSMDGLIFAARAD